MNNPCTAKRLLNDITDALEDITGDYMSASQEARAILEFVLDTEAVKILADLVKDPSPDQIKDIGEIVEWRRKRKPLAHILGRAWFYNHEFYLTDGVLVPRPATETLVDEAIKFLNGRSEIELKVLDLYTGCGNIILSIASENNRVLGTGVDFDADAILSAVRNRDALDLGSVEFITENSEFILKEIPEKYILVTANPPYIPTDDIPFLQPEIPQYEKQTAIDGGPDGLNHYRLMSASAKNVLDPDGILLSEIGIGQKDRISDLFSDWADVQFIQDLNGLPRVLCAKP